MSRERWLNYDPNRIPMYEGPPRFTRREFIIGLGALSATALVGGAIWGTASRREEKTAVAPGKSVDLGEVAVLEEIKTFESQVGTDTLSIFQAKNYYLPLVAEYFRRYLALPTIGVNRSTEDILRNTFVIRRDFTSDKESSEEFKRMLTGKDEEVLTSPPVRLLSLDYPDFAMTAKRARGIIGRMAMGALGWVEGGQVFIVFDRVNNTRTSIKYKLGDKEGEYPVWQFEGLGYQVKCSPPAPVVNLRSTYLHELVHWDADGTWQGLPADVVSSFQRIDNKESYRPANAQVKYKAAQVMDFIAKFEREAGDSTMETGLDEFVTDYLAARMSIFDRLAYTLGYHGSHSPAVFENFAKVLSTSRLSNVEVFKLHRESRLTDFLLKVAAGARDITFKDDEERLDFAIKHLLYRSDFNLHYAWRQLRPHFWGLDTTEYKYYVDPNNFKPSPGIPWQDPRLDVPPTELGCLSK